LLLEEPVDLTLHKLLLKGLESVVAEGAKGQQLPEGQQDTQTDPVQEGG
jgi:hypothetical protein